MYHWLSCYKMYTFSLSLYTGTHRLSASLQNPAVPIPSLPPTLLYILNWMDKKSCLGVIWTSPWLWAVSWPLVCLASCILGDWGTHCHSYNASSETVHRVSAFLIQRHHRLNCFYFMHDVFLFSIILVCGITFFNNISFIYNFMLKYCLNVLFLSCLFSQVEKIARYYST